MTVTVTVAKRPLRGLAIIVACFLTAEFGSWIAVTTVAHGFGGVHEAAAVMVAQLAPAAVFATAAGSLAQRWGERRVLQAGLAAQTLGLASIAALLAVPNPLPIAVYAAAVVASIAVVTTRPVIAAILPSAVDDPRELATANAAFGWLDGAAMLVGPVIAAVAIDLSGAWLAFVVFAALTATATWMTGRVGGGGRVVVEAAEPAALAVATRTARDDAGVRSVLVALAACSFAVGALDLLYVVVAVDVLGGTGADAGWLNTAFGVGALIGGAIALALARRRSIWPRVIVSTLVMTVALALLGLGRHLGAAALLLAACGIGEAVLMISARTLLQRVAD
ncbi:MAG: transporter, partial [Actinomycetia bacterium]|nr:transporter [Actinomycetes bacterium]